MPWILGGKMAAGDRAAEQARRAGERVARLRRELEQAERNEQAWAVGAAGEAMVASKMNELAAYGWMALHDVHWPGRPKANLDHILIGPGGIIVVDAKNWSGNVEADGGRLRQNGFRRDKDVLAASEQSAAVAALLAPQHRRHVRGWICLVGQPAVDEAAGSAGRLVGLERLCPAALGLPAVLTDAEVRMVHASLNEQLSGASAPRLLTTAQFTGADLAGAQAPSASLRPWQTRRQPGTREARGRSPRRRSKRPSCLLVLLRLVMLLVGLSLLMNFALGHRSTRPATPLPSPTTSYTLPAVPAR